MSDAPTKLAGCFIEWQRIEDAKADLAEQSKDLFKAMKDEGHDTKAMRVVFREKRASLEATLEDEAKVQEFDAVVDVYRQALNEGLAARARPARSAREIIEEFPRPASSAAADGQPSIPSLDDVGAKRDGGNASSSGGPAGGLGFQDHKSGQAVTNSGYEPPAFLRKTMADYRPHCQNPDECASYGPKHCNACAKAAGEQVAA
jgi:uncharacterized protein (UPF0335 family)